MPKIDPKQKQALIEAALDPVRELCRACRLCGRECRVDRMADGPGFCATDSANPEHVRYSSATLHFGEEPPLVGRGGSGTVFFAHCNLRCVFCQNYQISQFGLGDDAGYKTLADDMLRLERVGAENINLVTPTHYIYPILLALREAYSRGLTRPLVYNTNGFDSVALLRLLDGIVDIYLPDVKYSDHQCALQYSNARQYPEVARAAVLEMYRQVGPLKGTDTAFREGTDTVFREGPEGTDTVFREGSGTDTVFREGSAERNTVSVPELSAAAKGIIIRHLVLPEDQSGSYDFLLWLKDAGLMDVTLSIMRQYSPQHRAMQYPQIARPITDKEYTDIVHYAADLGFENLLIQGADSPETYLPDFTRDEPFEK